MTDNERMDRAKRIREMREGARDDGAEESPSDESNDRTDGGDPEKQTMEDIVEASEGVTTTAESSDEPTEVADETDEPTEAAEETAEPTETEAATTEPATTAEPTGETSSTAETSPTAGGQTSESTATNEAAASDGNTTEETMTEPTTTDGATTDAGRAEGTGGDTGGETGSDADAGVTAPLPEMDELEEALDGSAATADPETVSPGVADDTVQAGGETTGQAGARQESAEETTEEETRVLEFTLDDEHYCLDIQYIEEIVKHENITRVPNTPGHVEGVVDLRGQITTILNPKVTIGKENDEAGELIVVFDAEAFEDQGYIGWVVDDVRQVSPIVESEVNDPPMAEDYINGVIDREDDEEFVIWTSPDLAFDDED